MYRLRQLARAISMAGVMSMLLAGSASAADESVTIAGFAFDPGTVRIQIGDTVTWTNQDAVPHTATSTAGAFDTGELATGQSFPVAFATAGNYEYMCSVHPTMTGSIVVQGAAGVPAMTPAPTDTLPLDGPDDGGGILITLTVLGLAMLLGTIVVDRRLRERDR